MRLVIENIITDLRRNGIRVSKDIFDALNTYVDIQNSSLSKLPVTRWQDVKGKNVLLVSDGDIVAVYGDDRFMYNPGKIKISQAPDYDVYEINVGGVNVIKRREQRKDTLHGLVRSKDSAYSNTPRSTTLIWSKDWDPEINKTYYTKLLAQRHLKRYIQQLEDAYDVIKELIDQRRDRLTGKRSEYDRMITDVSKQITKIEDELVAVERDFNMDDTKLKKELGKLPNMVSKAQMFLKSEEQEYKRFGKRKPLDLSPITK